MRLLAVLTLLAVAISGCNRPVGTGTTTGNRTGDHTGDRTTTGVDGTGVNSNVPGGVRTSERTTLENPTAIDRDRTVHRDNTIDRDNTGVNERDRSDAAKTSFDQNENQTDIDITANIRSKVVDTEMSVNAQNVKIITQDGQVTLRGPVKSDAEKQQIEAIATSVAGAGKVDSQLEVEQP